MFFAIAAVISFVVALALLVFDASVGGDTITGFTLVGLALLAAHFAVPVGRRVG